MCPVDTVCLSATCTAAAQDQSGLTTCNVLATRRLYSTAHMVAGAFIHVVTVTMCQSSVATVSVDNNIAGTVVPLSDEIFTLGVTLHSNQVV